MTTLNPYLNFGGNCEEAFRFYKGVFGGEFTGLQRYGEAPGDHSPAEAGLVMHVALPIGGGVMLMGSDRPPAMGPVTSGNNVHIAIFPESEAEAARIFNALAAGGQVTMPLEKVFWGATFGALTDRYGIQWMVNYQGSQA